MITDAEEKEKLKRKANMYKFSLKTILKMYKYWKSISSRVINSITSIVSLTRKDGLLKPKLNFTSILSLINFNAQCYE